MRELLCKPYLLTVFIITLFFPSISLAVERTLPKLGVADPESNRFLCKSQMGVFLRYTGIHNELKGEAKEGTDTFSIFIKGDETVGTVRLDFLPVSIARLSSLK